MSMFTGDYWKTFGKYVNITNEQVSESGPTAKKTNGDSYSEQDGNSVSKQNGNKNTLQVGWSNALTYGLSFSTLGGASFSTTGGAAVSNHVGLKWAMFVGLEMSVNAAASVKVAYGGAYTFDHVAKWETAAQKAELVAKRETFADKIVDVLVEQQEIGTQFSTVAGKSIHQITGEYDLLSAGTIGLTTATNVSVTAANIRLLGMASMEIRSAKVEIFSGVATIGGGIIKIG